MFVCVCVDAAAANTLDEPTHLVPPGQGACVLPASIAAAPERAPVPQGAFLPQSVIQDEVLLAALVTEPVEIHGSLQLQRCPRTCSSSSSSLRGCEVWPGCATESRKCQSGNPHHVTSVVDSHLHLGLLFLFSVLEAPFPVCQKSVNHEKPARFL